MSLALPLVESRGIYVCCDRRATNFRSSASIRPGSFGCSQPAQTHAPDAKPVHPLGASAPEVQVAEQHRAFREVNRRIAVTPIGIVLRSEEHTSELQSLRHLV